MTRKNPERPKRTVKEIVEYNASMIHETYESVMKLRRAVAILHDELIRDELEDLPEIPELEDLPDPELEEVARRHAEWNGKSPHPYGCDGGEGGEPEIVLCHSEELEDLDQVEERPDAEVKKYVEPIQIAGKLEIQIGMLDGSHNREFCLHTTNHYGLIRESGSDVLTPFWTTRLKTEELMELRAAISEALLIASRFE